MGGERRRSEDHHGDGWGGRGGGVRIVMEIDGWLWIIIWPPKSKDYKLGSSWRWMVMDLKLPPKSTDYFDTATVNSL